MLTLPHFQVTEQVYESENSLIYRAIRHTDKKSVILKWLKADFPSTTQLARYQHEYELLSQLRLPGIIEVCSLEKWQDHIILVLEDFGGSSLNFWFKHRSLSLTEWLPLVIQMADSLGQLHAAHVIHKDINPANFVWNPTTKVLKLIDFGIATRLPRETLALQNPNQLEGTLPYLSPEQTGRMNRALDYRTDLYSLGVTFYELLTGQLPFKSQDAMELIHCHLAKQPMPPHEIKADIPPIVSHLILRLMAKASEERYQSAWGVKADLESILGNLTGSLDLSAFALGEHDFSDHFQLPQKLYGREEELQQLLTAFESVATGESQLLLVTGYSGIGKSVLVQELYQPITEKRGYFIAGKFDQFQRNIPYSAVVQAFRDLVRQLLTETQSQLDAWKAQILAAIGINGQILVEVIPEIELLLGKQSPISVLPPTESQNRFNLVFQNFIRVFCQPAHPLVIFLDDLQWIDSASLKLMTLMMSDIPYLLLIGAYRDNEVSAVHPFIMNLEEMQKQGVLIHTLNLSPLTLNHLNQLISDTLHLPGKQTLPLAELVLEKTGGNPFFSSEFLKTLFNEHLLVFNQAQRMWQWSITQIKARNITDNIVALMTSKIQQLAEITQQRLMLAAALGNQFDVATMAMVSEQSTEQIKRELWEALVTGLIVPIEEKYKFVHDRIQQAAYSLIPAEEKPSLHWHISRLLLKETATVEERLFEIVDHLNLGYAQAKSQAERLLLIRLNLQAGKKAKLATAYGLAVEYLQFGLDYLEDDSWHTHYALALDLHTEAAESYYLNANFEQSQQLADIALQQAHSLLEKVKIYEILIQSYVAQNQLQRSLDTSLTVLEMLGVTLVANPPAVSNVEDLLLLPVMTAPDRLAAMRILNFATSMTYAVAPTLFPKIAFTLVDLSIKHGNSSLSAFGYALYGVLLCSVFDDIDTSYRFGRLSLQVLDKFAAQEFKAKVFACTYSTIIIWKHHLKQSLAPLQETIQNGLDSGDREFACLATMYYCSHFFWLGHPLETVTQTLSKYLDVVKQANQEYQQVYINIWAQIAFNLQTPTIEPGRLMGPWFNEEELLPTLLSTNYGMAIFSTYLAKTVLNYWFEDYAQSVVQGQLAASYAQTNAGAVVIAIHNFYYSLAMLAHYPQVDASEQNTYLTSVTVHQSKMKYWASQAPTNYQHKYDLVAAEKARCLGHQWEAVQYYEKAITGARENEYLQEEALAYELAARFYLYQGMEAFTRIYLVKAYSRCQHWGATAKLKQMERQYPQWLPPRKATSASTSSTILSTLPTTRLNTTRFAAGTEWLDLASVMKAAQTLSGEIVLENLLTQMMYTVIENAGAQRGVLILEHQTQWLIQAEMTVQPQTVTVLQATPLEGLVPTALLNYVIRTKQSLVFSDIQKEAKYQEESYVRTHALKSVLALTLLHQQKLVGVIYLENNLTAGVFTPDRFQVLTLLSSQMAISLENARFVHELEQTRQAEAQARQVAEAANRAKTAFLANVSHELKTPLNGILGCTQLLKRDSQLTNEQRKSIETIHYSGEHLLTLVNDILDISRFQTAKIELQLTDVSLNKLLSDLSHWYQDQAQEKQLTFHAQFSPTLPTGIIADDKRLRQVLLQILGNAVKFTQKGGITFQVESKPLENPTGWHHFWFTITDSGIGMSPDHLSKLFTPFEQASDWLHKSAGVGLGLSLAKQLVELMGGQIQVTSQVEQGSTFVVELDFAPSYAFPSEALPKQIEVTTVEETVAPLKGPPPKVAEELYDLAQMGDFLGILKLIQRLEKSDDTLRPFTEKVRQFAKNYQDELIEELVKQFMKQ